MRCTRALAASRSAITELPTIQFGGLLEFRLQPAQLEDDRTIASVECSIVRSDKYEAQVEPRP